MSGPDEQTILRVAKAINGPRDATHIGTEKLRELQDYRWNYQASKADKQDCICLARAAIAAMPDTTAKARNDALREAADAAFQRLRVWVWDCDQNSDFAKQRKATDIEVRDVILALIDKETPHD